MAARTVLNTILRGSQGLAPQEDGSGVSRFAGTTLSSKIASFRPIFTIGEAGFLEVEVALDSAPDLVGDLAVDSRRRDIVDRGSSGPIVLMDIGENIFDFG
jgi:hypothetical protein